jgi:RNA polymerase sigma factor (TIGR02999 family)
MRCYFFPSGRPQLVGRVGGTLLSRPAGQECPAHPSAQRGRPPARAQAHLLAGRPSGDYRQRMSKITQILGAIERGDPGAAGELLPLVYEELRRLAAHKLAREEPGQTLQATALVHEAYLRLVDVERAQHWNSRGHFFAAAAEAMRRILVEQARRKASLKRGGELQRQEWPKAELTAPAVSDELLALDEALTLLAQTDTLSAELVKLRYFAGLTSRQAAEVLGISARTADRTWAYARAWLLKKLQGG